MLPLKAKSGFFNNPAINGDLARYEMKYLVDVSLLPALRDFILLFCDPDPYCRGTPAQYETTTLQFDNVYGDLCLMKENKALNRFKLRARIYGRAEQSPLFLEIKRKSGDVIIKSRAFISPGWGNLEDIIKGDRMPPGLKQRDYIAFHEFIRLVRQIQAQPVMRVRYIRESYVSSNDSYARVTFDKSLRYMPSRDFQIDPPTGRWRRMDSSTGTQRPFPCFVLELKSTGDMPSWMAELIERFNLSRCDFCKYATAMRMESIHRGFSYSDASENTTY